jgi:hypothetical protein
MNTKHLVITVTDGELKLIRSSQKERQSLVDNILACIIDEGSCHFIRQQCDFPLLLDNLNDLQVFLGFDENYDLNPNGRLLENLIDRIVVRLESLEGIES